MEEKDLKYFNVILRKFNQGIASPEEVEFLEKYYNLFEEKESFLNCQTPQLQETIKHDIKNKVDAEINLQTKTSSLFNNNYLRYFAAASILLVLSVTGYFALKSPTYQAIGKNNDFTPGVNTATLELANGTKILLDTAAKGVIAQLDGIKVYKNAAGEIQYKVQSAPEMEEVTFNTITTPKGGQYQVVLHDGSKVWLNAASSLKYPTAFKGKDRTVTITGEAYLEVAKNKQMPFKVTCGKQTIEVLGTHFNVNAYEDEATIKTTLLEGAVRVSADRNSTTIVPGEQTSYDYSAGSLQKKTVDVEQEMAWKNGLFSFKGEDVKAIMRQISRWYNVEIEYSGSVTDEKFYGQISRNSKLSEVFAILELNNVHFKSNGRKITVSN
ncbi:FecR family protein [Pedobacter frigiditerrae]|uniref:FecR family protein n=1 Tax=Pedobacter frigiditerrae TaxID=2530452 RepID=A0A4R0MMQ7_9SPHI|nr:FecR family protein [Pedobacter frigiditerrae]TCC87264.1 FecR family protein [Pedobacter frigiditerrae]